MGDQLHTPGVVAARQHGIVTHGQLLRAGLTAKQIASWARRGRLIRLRRGVYAVGHLPPSPHATTMAALLACGPSAVLSHRSAAKLWGLIRYDGPIEVTANNTRRRTGIVVHRSKLTDTEVTRHWDLPVTTAARTLQDLAHTLTPAALTRAINDARLRHLLSVDDPRRPTRSALEDAFLTFIARHKLPPPEVNTTIAGYEVDMLWRPQRLIAELDGHETHRFQFETDREKDADLLTAGFRVVRVTWERLTDRPAKEAARFRALLA
jgi:very-short-patch-repair endonuclease